MLLQMTQDPPSFTSARDLRDRFEMLPGVPEWRVKELTIPGYSTKEPMVLYYRDGLEVVEHMFANPVFAQCMEYTPYRLFDDQGARAIGEFMSANFAWDYMVCSLLSLGSKILIQ